MAQATRSETPSGDVVWTMNSHVEGIIKTALFAQQANPASRDFEIATQIVLQDLGFTAKPTFRVVTPPAPKMPLQYSRVRMLKDCGRWITPGEEGVIAYIDFDVINPESDTQFTVVFSPGRYQTMTRECFEVL